MEGKTVGIIAGVLLTLISSVIMLIALKRRKASRIEIIFKIGLILLGSFIAFFYLMLKHSAWY